MEQPPIKLMEGVAAASTGVYTLALKTDGTLWSRGQGGWSQLLDDVTAIDQGGGSCVAIKENGSLWLWGDNRFCQLAPGGVKEDYAEVPVDGTLWPLGMGDFGKLGSGQTEEGKREGAAYRGKPIQILDYVAKVTAGWPLSQRVIARRILSRRMVGYGPAIRTSSAKPKLAIR